MDNKYLHLINRYLSEMYHELIAIYHSSAIFVMQYIMTEKRKIWLLLILSVISLISGPSYKLMKKGLESFSSLQVRSLRILITFLCLLQVALMNLPKLNRSNILFILIIGFLGNGIPAFLFPIAQTGKSISLAGMLNSLSPVFTATVSYFIPVVTTILGIADNEHLTLSMLVSVMSILAGVFIINRPGYLKNYQRFK